jgi:alpha-amylase
MLRRLLVEMNGKFKVSFSFSGTWLSQCQQYDPALLELYHEIVSSPYVEVLCETSHHTLSSLVDLSQFKDEIRAHRHRVLQVFGKDAVVFRNTELIYSDAIGAVLEAEGFSGCLIEGWEHLLDSDFDMRHVFYHPELPSFKLLPRHYRRSDDIAFRFSNRHWSEWPLSGEKFQKWLQIAHEEGASFVGLFMDFETIGEHQWRETGIFEFVDYWLRLACADSTVAFVTPSEAISSLNSRGPVSAPYPVSWADRERDVSAWLGNSYQRQAISEVYSLASLAEKAGSNGLNEHWRRLLSSDHFYYMSNKCSSDGEVHGYFSPFSQPIESYLEYRNALSDLKTRLLKVGG